MQKSKTDFWTNCTGWKGNTPLFSLCWECHKHHYDLRLPIFSSELSRHLLQSAQGSSLVTYASTLRLWCLLEQYDHEIRFTWSRTRVEKSKMEIWNWMRPANGLCDLDYTFNLSVMLLSIKVAAIYCGYSSTFRPVFFSTGAYRGPFTYRWGTWNSAATWFFFFLRS